MMLRPRWHHQSTLLERYLAALASKRRAAPPADLDQDLAALAEYLTETRQQLQPSTAFVERLRRSLETGDADASRDHTWRRPSIDRRRPAPSPPSDNGEPGTADTIMSHVMDTPVDIPLPIPRRLAHEWLKIAAAILAFLVAGSLLVLVLRDEQNDGNVAAPVPTPTAVVTPSAVSTEAGVQPTPATTMTGPTATVSLDPAITLPSVEPTITTIPVNEPWTVAVGAGSVWVTNDREGTVSRIDPATNTVVATIEVARAGNHSANAIAAGDTAVWVVAGILNLVWIDPLTNQIVSTTPIDQPVDQLAIGNGVVWLLSSDSNLLRRFDPTTSTITASIDIARPQSATVTDAAVWVVRDAGRGTDSEILKIDPATATVVTTVSLDGYFTYGLAAVDGSLWAPTDRALLRIDIGTGQIVATYLLPQPVRGVPPMTTGDGSIWVCDCTSEPDDVLWQFDVDTLAWSAEIPAGDLGWESWLAYLDDAVWGYNNPNEVVHIQLPE